MKDDQYELVIEALSEDYSEAELNDTGFMIAELGKLLGSSEAEAIELILGARERQKLWRSRIPEWKKHLEIH